MFKTLFAAGALTLAAACLTPAFADDNKVVRSISLSGHGEVRMAPDLAIVTVGVMSSAATAREALDANTKAMEGVMASLTAAGIEARDIQTSNFSVNPRYDYGQNFSSIAPQPPKVIGYDVSNNVSVTMRKLTASVRFWIRSCLPVPTRSTAWRFRCQSPKPQLMKRAGLPWPMPCARRRSTPPPAA